MSTELPDQILVTDDDGSPLSIIDVDKMQSDSTRLMYEMAASAGDDAATDAIGIAWAAALHPDQMGYVSAGALSLLTRNVLAPLLDVLDEVMPKAQFRAKLAEARDNAEATLNGGS